MSAMSETTGPANEVAGLGPVPAPRVDVALSADPRLAAIAAGARARGIADGFDMLGIAAILLDADATVLNVNRQAAACMGPRLGVCAGQLIAATFEDNARLQEALDAALTGRASRAVAISRPGQADLVLHIRPAPGQDEAFQLLKAIVVIAGTADGGPETALLSRLLRDGAALH